MGGSVVPINTDVTLKAGVELLRLLWGEHLQLKQEALGVLSSSSWLTIVDGIENLW